MIYLSTTFILKLLLSFFSPDTSNLVEETSPTLCACSPTTDSLALVDFYNATNGANWTNTWDLSQPMDTWWGITLDENGCVQSFKSDVDLVGRRLDNNIRGTLPPSFGNLVDLDTLDLGRCRFDSIPDAIGNLINLKWLFFDNMIFQDAVLPSTIGNLSDLTYLVINSNTNLSGGIPPEIGNLSNLTNLRLRADFTGEIPAEIGNLRKLERLQIVDNANLGGTIPPEIGTMSSLRILELRNNNLVGSIPTELGNLNLTGLYLDRNRLSGSIPTTLKVSTYFDLSNNQLEGVLSPALFTTDFNPNDIWLQNNQLTGFVPKELGRFAIRVLDLSNNPFSGQLPDSLANSYFQDFTRQINLNNANLEGCFPNSYHVFCGLDSINFSNNSQLPNNGDFDAFCTSNSGACLPCRQRDSLALVDLYNATNGANWTNTWNLNQPMDTWFGITTNTDGCVTIVDLGNNNLVGTLPNSLGNMYQLSRLLLSQNQLTGSIPAALETCYELRWLYLSQNQLSGTIPVQLGNLANLEHLLLNENGTITGAIPPELGNLSNLQLLYLGSNDMTGTIPNELWQLTELRQLLLTGNNFSGIISEEIGNLTHLNNLRITDNNFSGELPITLWSLYDLSTLNVSNNNFTGSLPPNVGSLKKLIFFDLHDNSFSGVLPPELGEMELVQRLQLQNNMFSGELPPEIANLENLDFFTVQNNQLTGCFPVAYSKLCDLSTYNFTANNGLSNNGDFTAFCNGTGGACLDNDECVDAILLPMNLDPCGIDSREVVLSGASSVDSPYGSCSASFNNKDIWFKAVVPSTGNFLIRKDSATNVNLYAEAYLGCPNDITDTIACAYLGDNPHVLAVAQDPSFAGQEVYIRLWSDAMSGLAKAEISAHQLSEHPDNWQLCDYKESEEGLADGRGVRNALEFMVQYDEDDTQDSIERKRNVLINEFGATLIDRCNCSNGKVELWRSKSIIDLEGTKLGAKAKGNVDTTSYNYNIQIVAFLDTLEQGVISFDNDFVFGNDVGIDAEGNYGIVVDANNGQSPYIYTRFYNAFGTPKGDSNILTRAINRSSAKIAMNSLGEYVVTWAEVASVSTSNLIVNRFNKFNFLIESDTILSTHNQYDIDIFDNGKYSVIYKDVDTNIHSYNQYSSTGDLMFRKELGAGFNPRLAYSEAGIVVVAWKDSTNIEYRLFEEDGELRHTGNINSVGFYSYLDDVAIDEIGNFLIIWNDNNELYAKRFDFQGNSLSSNFYIDNGYLSSIAMNESGDFIIVWEYSDGFTINGIFAQYFNNSGQPIGEKIKLSSSGALYSGKASINENGNVVIIYHDFQNGGRFNKKLLYSPSSNEPLTDVRTTFDTLGVEKETFVPYVQTGQVNGSVKVAVMDSGTNLNDPLLNPAYWSWTNAASNCEPLNMLGDKGIDYIAPDGTPDAQDDHGPAVNARLTAGFPADIELELINVKFFENGESSLFDVVCGIYYAVEQGANIINMSWGFESIELPSILKDALEYAQCQDVLIVTSAGNTGRDNTKIKKYPSNFSELANNIITVGAYERNASTLAVQRAAYSNFGDNVDILAPGFVETLDGEGNIVSLVGTSLAAPEVARVAAIIRARYPSLRAVEVKECILDGAMKVNTLTNLVRSDGILDEVGALSFAAQKAQEASSICENPAIDLNANVVEETCAGNDGQIDLIVNSSIPTLNFAWSNGAMTEDLTNLSAATYTVTVTDDCGCGQTLTIEVQDECTGGNCENNRTVNDETLVGKIYRASETIASEAIVESDIQATFQAGDQITLRTGFRAAKGSNFVAQITGCTPTPTQPLEQRSQEEDRATLQLYPNPADESVTLEYQASSTSRVTIGLYGANGRLLNAIPTNNASLNGWQRITLPLHDLQSGVYWVQLRSADQILVEKLVVAR